MAQFERLSSETRYTGRIIDVRVDRVRYDDGGEADREVIIHPGAVAIVCHDGADLHLVAQPREPVDAPALLELPSGKLDRDTGDPLETAQRELAEEVGVAADKWTLLRSYWNDPAISDARFHIYLATGLSTTNAHLSDEEERINIVRWPLLRLDELLNRVEESKTIIGLLELRKRL